MIIFCCGLLTEPAVAGGRVCDWYVRCYEVVLWRASALRGLSRCLFVGSSFGALATSVSSSGSIPSFSSFVFSSYPCPSARFFSLYSCAEMMTGGSN